MTKQFVIDYINKRIEENFKNDMDNTSIINGFMEEIYETFKI